MSDDWPFGVALTGASICVARVRCSYPSQRQSADIVLAYDEPMLSVRGGAPVGGAPLVAITR